MTNKIMDWNYCERKFVRIVSRDEKRISSLVDKAKLRLKRIEKVKETREMISLIFEDYYEVIKELLVAYMLKNGLRSLNHQCLISYFYLKNPNMEKWANLIQQMSYFRNRLNYYGEDIPSKFYDLNKREFKKIIDFLIEILGVGG